MASLDSYSVNPPYVFFSIVEIVCAGFTVMTGWAPSAILVKLAMLDAVRLIVAAQMELPIEVYSKYKLEVAVL
jgi:hypothetical protein